MLDLGQVGVRAKWGCFGGYRPRGTKHYYVTARLHTMVLYVSSPPWQPASRCVEDPPDIVSDTSRGSQGFPQEPTPCLPPSASSTPAGLSHVP